MQSTNLTYKQINMIRYVFFFRVYDLRYISITIPTFLSLKDDSYETLHIFCAQVYFAISSLTVAKIQDFCIMICTLCLHNKNIMISTLRVIEEHDESWFWVGGFNDTIVSSTKLLLVQQSSDYQNWAFVIRTYHQRWGRGFRGNWNGKKKQKKNKTFR